MISSERSEDPCWSGFGESVRRVCGTGWGSGNHGPVAVPGARNPSCTSAVQLFPLRVEPVPDFAVERVMTKKDKIAFIKSSKRKTHVYNDLHRFSDQQLNDVIREIVQGLVRESEIIANAYINGYR